jgi:hypothetical protein
MNVSRYEVAGIRASVRWQEGIAESLAASSMRLFEANQRVLQAQDERMGRGIIELGNPS